MIEIEGKAALLFHAAQWAGTLMAHRAPNETIHRGGDPFFDRWFLGRKITVPTWIASRTAPGDHDRMAPMPTELENLYLHRFLRSDCEDMHCHPWDNVSVVIFGRYLEASPEGEVWRTPGQIVVRKAIDRHAIVAAEPGTISLFATGPKCREWGFWPDAQTFVHHEHYAEWRASRGLVTA